MKRALSLVIDWLVTGELVDKDVTADWSLRVSSSRAEQRRRGQAQVRVRLPEGSRGGPSCQSTRSNSLVAKVSVSSEALES